MSNYTATWVRAYIVGPFFAHIFLGSFVLTLNDAFREVRLEQWTSAGFFALCVLLCIALGAFCLHASVLERSKLETHPWRAEDYR